MKDPFAPYIHLFLLFWKFLVFAYTRIGPDPGRRFDTTKRGYVLSATRIFPRDRRSRRPADSTDCVSSITSFCFFFTFPIFSISLFNIFSAREIRARAISWKVFFSLEPPSFHIYFSLLPYPPFFRLALNKYRFRLSELTPVSALYPLLTRIEFRTEDRFLFCRDLHGGSRDIMFSPFSFFFFYISVKQCWPAGPEVRRCVCPKGDFDQTQSIPLNLHAHPRRALCGPNNNAGKVAFFFLIRDLVAMRLRVEN